MNHLKLLQLLQDNRRAFTPIRRAFCQRIGTRPSTCTTQSSGAVPLLNGSAGFARKGFVPALRALGADRITRSAPTARAATCSLLRPCAKPCASTGQDAPCRSKRATRPARDQHCLRLRRVTATKGSKYMIHRSWTFAMGNADSRRRC